MASEFVPVVQTVNTLPLVAPFRFLFCQFPTVFGDDSMMQNVLQILVLVVGINFVSSIFCAERDAVWDRPSNVQWKNVPLRDTLKRFSDAHKIGFLLDRRIDPSILISFEKRNTPLDEIFEGVSNSFQLETAFIGKTVYIGPIGSGTNLMLQITEFQNELESIPSKQAAIFRKKISRSISRPIVPKEILKQWGDQNRLQWNRLEELPHDIWEETTLSDVTFGESLILFLIGFDKTLKLDNSGKTLILETIIPDDNQRDLRRIDFAAKVREKDSAQTPQKQIKNSSSKIPLSKRRFTLRVENVPIESLLRSLANRLEIVLIMDENLWTKKSIAPDQCVSFDIKNATISDLLQEIFKSTQITFRIDGDTIYVQ
ncbi:MAG: STN domain-containing protein [Thermoguttaceae bacterium]